MPGIVGLITKLGREWAEPQLRRMLRAVQHEPGLVTGIWIEESLGCYGGWTARKDSFAEEMPIHNETNKITLIFSGEEYSEQGIVCTLKQKGHEFKAGSSSYLVHLYEEDASFPRNLNGHFQGIVADRVQKTATLFNDRFGVQRVYFHQNDEAFYFSAEAKAILEVRPELREFDSRGLGEFIACGCVLENRTLFAGIETLPPGSAWTFRNGSLEKKTLYFDPAEWEEQEALKPDAYYDQLRDSFANALPRYFMGERVGVSLTGGLDTRIIMAWRKAEPNTLPCYTFGSMYRENQDVHLARRVAEICKQPYQLITVSKEVVERFPELAERTIYLTDGCVDVSRSLDLYNNAMAREIAPVRMAGTFGSEIIRGAVMFKHKPPEEGIFAPEILHEVSRARATYDDQILRGDRTSAVAFRQTAAYHYGGLALEQSQLTMRWPYLDNDVVKAVFRAPRDGGQGEDVRFRLVRDGSRELARLRTDRGLNGSKSIGSAIRHAYLEFTFKAEYAYDYGMPQWVAQVDHAFEPFHLERIWLGRHKLFHFRYWYRTILAKYVQEMLLDSKSLARPYLKGATVEKIVQGHIKGNRNYTTEIHRLLSLELLHRRFLDSRN